MNSASVYILGTKRSILLMISFTWNHWNLWDDSKISFWCGQSHSTVLFSQRLLFLPRGTVIKLMHALSHIILYFLFGNVCVHVGIDRQCVLCSGFGIEFLSNQPKPYNMCTVDPQCCLWHWPKGVLIQRAWVFLKWLKMVFKSDSWLRGTLRGMGPEWKSGTVWQEKRIINTIFDQFRNRHTRSRV